MLERKRKLEEKMDTHVLNLQEIKQVATTEKKERKQKNTPLLLFFLGLFMIVMGILYPIIMDTLDDPPTEISDIDRVDEGEKTTPVEGGSVSSKLNCVTVVTDQKISKTVRDTYEFEKELLTKISTTTEIKALNDEGKLQVSNGASTFYSLYGSVDTAGVSKNINLAGDNSSLTTVLTIDYNRFDMNQYNRTHPQAPFFTTYESGTSKADVTKSMLAQGATCE